MNRPTESATEARYINEKELARITGRAVQTLRNDRHTGKGFPYIKNGRSVRYYLPDIYQHMEAHRVTPYQEDRI